MRKVYIIMLVALLLVGGGSALLTTSCKAELDKTKIAGLLVGFIVNYASGQEINVDALDGLAVELSLSFVDAYSGEIPARYRDETLAFARTVIPKLIEDYGLSGLGPDAEGDEQMLADMAERVLDDFEEFHEDYK